MTSTWVCCCLFIHNNDFLFPVCMHAYVCKCPCIDFRMRVHTFFPFTVQCTWELPVEETNDSQMRKWKSKKRGGGGCSPRFSVHLTRSNTWIKLCSRDKNMFKATSFKFLPCIELICAKFSCIAPPLQTII